MSIPELETESREEEACVVDENSAKKRKRVIAAITMPVILVCIAFIIVLTKVIIPKIQYNKAVEIFGKEWADTIMNASVGDTIKYGSYEQDNDTSNGKEEIEWTVIDKNGVSLLLISNKALDCRQYN